MSLIPDDQWILANRSAKNKVDPNRPYAAILEQEYAANGSIEDVLTVFLTNKECPFRCLMCDLWKNTTNSRVPDGAIQKQIQWALEKFPDSNATTIKLYNSGNFFDPQAIPRSDRTSIAELVEPFKKVIVECHPRLIKQSCIDFGKRIKGQLQVAMGLETVHPDVLLRLNKRMTLDDYSRSTETLLASNISVRAFILLRPPYLNESEGIYWAKASIDYAQGIGVECCVVIPTRTGNGALDKLEQQDLFSPPTIQSLETVLEHGLSRGRDRVFADLWDIEKFVHCTNCASARIKRIQAMNLTQTIPAPVECNCSADHD